MKELKTGMMVFLALLVFAATVLLLGQFGERVQYVVRFPKVLGLTSDSPVQLNGVPVGRVSRISFAKDLNDQYIYVTMSIEAAVKDRINDSTVADINTMGVLGDKYISLETTDFSKKPLPEGSVIKIKPSLNVEAMLAKGKGILDDMEVLTSSVSHLVESARTGKGLVGVLINNPEIGKSLIDSVTIISKNLSEGTGFIGKLINDKKFCSTVSNRLDSVSSDISQILDAMNHGKGTAGVLLKDEAFGEQFRANTLAALDGLKTLGNALSKTSDKSVLITALQDDQAGDDFKASLKSLRSILEKIDSGEGTLGKLVNDSSLYDNADEVFNGAKHSKLIKAGVRHSIKKARKAAEED